MRKTLALLILTFILSGCATYKFQKPDAVAQGYLAYYNDEPILEYTVGKEKSLPDLALAKERFSRRKSKVEYYYKEMDQMESRLKECFWDPPAMILDFFWGVLRWPFVAVADYKYNRNPEYKARVDRLDEEKEALETARLDSLRKDLDAYIVEDLVKESLLPAVVDPVVVQPVAEIKPIVAEEVAVTRLALEPPVAVIVAQPSKGSSPLKVNFFGQKSYSKSGKIVAYDWDFGDGDTSTKKNTQNTYWSATFGSRSYTATLTVRDDKGSTSTTSATIEVITK